MRDNEPFAGRTPIAPGDIAPMLRTLEARTADVDDQLLLRCAAALLGAREEMLTRAVASAEKMAWTMDWFARRFLLIGFALGLLAALVVWDLARWPEISAALHGGK